MAEPPEDVLKQIYTAPEAVTYASSFLAAVQVGQVAAIVDQLAAVAGPVRSVEAKGDGYVIRTDTHEIPATLALDGNGAVVGLFFRPPVATGGTLDDAADLVRQLDGTVSVLVTRSGQTVHSIAPEAPLAVGSAFKLGVLAVLADQIEEGARQWDDVVRLGPEHISLPTGLLQTMPVGAPVTLHTAAALMIGQSDNTATDLLLETVGVEAVAGKLGLDHVLGTRAFFVLKGDPALAAAYDAADAAGKSDIAETAKARPLPDAAALGPHDQGVEWYLPLTTLCSVLHSVKDLDVFSLNHGLAEPADWARIAYKGGSEGGVLNLTTWVETGAGEGGCVAMTVNADGPVDEAQAYSAYRAMLAAFRRSLDDPATAR